MSRKDKALLVFSLYRIASMLIRAFLEVKCWNVAISTHLQVYPSGTRYVSIAPC